MSASDLLLVGTLVAFSFVSAYEAASAGQVRADSSLTRTEIPSAGREMTFEMIEALRHSDRDCNNDSLPDRVDIAVGVSKDENRDGIPDDCESEGAVTRMALARSVLGLAVARDSARGQLRISYVARRPAQRLSLGIADDGGKTLKRLRAGRASGLWQELVVSIHEPLRTVMSRRPGLVVLRCDSLVVAKNIPRCWLGTAP
jgi:hypothetical protein